MKRNLVLLSLAVLVLGVSTASAQTTYQVTTVPTFVIDTGRAEVLGSVRITASNAGPTVASTIEYLFQGIGCDNSAASGITLTTSAALAASAIANVTNSSAGCIVSVTVPGAVATTAGVDFVEIGGVRGRVDLTAAAHPNHGTNINASMSATPSNSSLFTVPNQGVVGISAHGLEFVSATASNCLQCVATCTAPTLTFREGFNGAFVDHGADTTGTFPGAPTTPRPVFGGNRNTQVNIVLTGLPSGITLTWPATVASAIASEVHLLSQNTSGSTALYEYGTMDQGTSDINLETFIVSPTITVSPTAGFGTATAEIQLFPALITGDATSITSAIAAATAPRPRFNHPLSLEGSKNFVTNGPCTTTLLFPFVANIAGFDTGFAFANTSSDDAAFGTGAGAGAQSGTCTLNLFPADGTAAVSTTTASIAAGATGTVVQSAVTAFAGLSGYVIARCNFQYAHGFAFIVDNFGVGAPNTAQGYLALIIPDPTLNAPVGRPATDAGCSTIVALGVTCRNTGEGLGQ